MDVIAVLIVAAAIFVWGTLSARLERADITAPIVFVALGGFSPLPVWSTRRPPPRH